MANFENVSLDGSDSSLILSTLAEPEEVLLEQLLTQLQRILPSLRSASRSTLTTVEILEHAILYIRELWQTLDGNKTAEERKAFTRKCYNLSCLTV